MNERGLHRYVEDPLHGRRPRPFDADGVEAAQVRTAIELRAARTASDAPSEHFLTDLHRGLAALMPGGRLARGPLGWIHRGVRGAQAAERAGLRCNQPPIS